MCARTGCSASQKALFFKQERDGMNLNFSVKHDMDLSSERLEWHQLILKADFAQTLQIYGRLPYACTETALEERKSLADLLHLIENNDSSTATKL